MVENSESDSEDDQMPEWFSKLFSRLKWQDMAFIVILIALLIINFTLVDNMQQLPSPIYGGDLYNHLGSMEHIYQGGSIFESGQMNGEIQWVPWLYHVIIVLFAKLTGLQLIAAIGIFSLIAMIAAALIAYVFASKMFHNKIYGLIATIWVCANFPIFKYTHFSFYVMMPLFYLTAYLFMEKNDWKSAIWFGLLFGLTGLSNTHAFISSFIFIAIFMLYYVVMKSLSKHPHGYKIDKKIFLDHLAKGAVIFAIGFMIALLWWYKPIFVYHGHTINDLQIYGFPELTTFGQIVGLIKDTMVSEFLDFSSLFNTFFSIGSFLGLLLIFFIKEKKTEHILLSLLMISAFAGLFSPFITVPLMHTHLAPSYLFDAYLRVGRILLFCLFISIAAHYAGKLHTVLKYSLYILGGALMIYLVVVHLQGLENDSLTKASLTPMPTMFADTRSWVLQNTKLDDVFLTTNEDGFALNALTGRKLVTYRRTHAPSYTDMNQRQLDAAVMLYGNNDTIRNELLKKYNVKYLYWEPRWIQNEFQLSSDGQIQGFFDPLMFDYTVAREMELKQYNISYTHTTYYLDPAFNPNYPKRDVLVVMPSRGNYNDPWNPMLDRYLNLVKDINYNNQSYTRIYSVAG